MLEQKNNRGTKKKSTEIEATENRTKLSNSIYAQNKQKQPDIEGKEKIAC